MKENHFWKLPNRCNKLFLSNQCLDLINIYIYANKNINPGFLLQICSVKSPNLLTHYNRKKYEQHEMWNKITQRLQCPHLTIPCVKSPKK